MVRIKHGGIVEVYNRIKCFHPTMVRIKPYNIKDYTPELYTFPSHNGSDQTRPN